MENEKEFTKLLWVMAFTLPIACIIRFFKGVFR